MVTAKTLIASGILELFASTFLGWLMLVPKQPWGKPAAKKVNNWKMLGSAHLDFLMLGLMQIGVGAGIVVLEAQTGSLNYLLLMTGAWLNAFPYLIAGVTKLNPFSLSGSLPQIVTAAISAGSSVCITYALWNIGWAAVAMVS